MQDDKNLPPDKAKAVLYFWVRIITLICTAAHYFLEVLSKVKNLLK